MYKVHLIAKIFNKTEGIYYLKIFSHVVKMTIMRIILSLIAISNWYLHQLDVKTAFLRNDLNE